MQKISKESILKIMSRPSSVAEILKLSNVPVVCIDDHGLFTFINRTFTQTYGWTESELIGKPVTTIMPSQFRDAHIVGFSRFLATETARLTGKPLPLAILYKDETVADAEHFILAEKNDNRWRFAATITPRQHEQ